MSNHDQSSSITFNSGQRGLSSILQKLFRPLVQVVKMILMMQVIRYVMIMMLMMFCKKRVMAIRLIIFASYSCYSKCILYYCIRSQYSSHTQCCSSEEVSDFAILNILHRTLTTSQNRHYHHHQHNYSQMERSAGRK